MNDLDVLKQHRPDMPTPDPVTLARTRLALQSHQRPRRRLPHPRLLTAGALASVLVGALLISDVIGNHSSPPPGTAATASTFLAEAATHASADPDVPIPPGQYRHLTVLSITHENGRSFLSRYEWWYPHTLRPPFVLRYTPSTGPKPVSTVLTQVCLAAVIGRRHYFSGVAGGAPQAGCRPSWFEPTPSFLAKQPRDPDALYRALSDPRETGPKSRDPKSVEAEGAKLAFRRLTAVLLTGIVPQDLRIALYRAARLIPGVQLLNEVVVVNGTEARLVGLQSMGLRTDLIIDPRTGRLLGAREVVVDPAGGRRVGIPRGAKTGDVLAQTTITSRISKSVPAPSR